MRVDVTWEDITAAILDDGRGDPTGCPIARAIHRQEPGIFCVEVGGGKDIVIDDKFVYMVPEEVENFTWLFDDKGPVLPFSFEMEVKEGGLEYHQWYLGDDNEEVEDALLR